MVHYPGSVYGFLFLEMNPATVHLWNKKHNSREIEYWILKYMNSNFDKYPGKFSDLYLRKLRSNQ